MSLKRKSISKDEVEAVTEEIDFNSDEDPIDIENDSSDEELADSDFEDIGIDDDFYGLNLVDDTVSQNESDDDEWEDIDSGAETSSTSGISASIRSSPTSDADENQSTDSDDKLKSKSKSTDDSKIKSKRKSSKKLDSSKNEANSPSKSSSSKSDDNQTSEIEQDITSASVDQDKTSSTVDEYAEDSSDEEDLRNTIGNIPINWYEDYEHLGYGLDSLPIMKPKKGDTLDKFLERLENPDHDRTVFDKQTGQDVRLSDEDVNLINRIMTHKVPDPNFDLHAPFPDLYSHEVRKLPFSGRNLHKRSFLPCKAERTKVNRIASLMRRGLFKHRLDHLKKEKTDFNYDLWKPRSLDDPRLLRVTDHIPVPKMTLPGHIQSYNPPPEYLMENRDEKMLKGMQVKDHKLFVQFCKKYKSVRAIPGYSKVVKERYERLLDLYIAPRKRYQKIVAESKDFLPKLPDKKDLRPYPTMEAIRFEGHRSIIRTISVHPQGKYLASGSDDHTVRVWEVSTGRCLRTFEAGGAVKKVTWNPSPKLFLLGITVKSSVIFLNPETYLTDKLVVQQTNAIFREEVDQGDYITPRRVSDAVTWRKPTKEERANGYRVVVDHFKEVKEVVWHRQGDYFATLMPEGIHRSVLMHQLSRWRTQQPFQKNKGRVQTIAFHPKLPQLFVVTQSNIRIYDLKRQCLIKKVQANSRWVSCIAIHPAGEHFIIGTYDRRINWFEMECTKRPHLMRCHTGAVRSVCFHRKYPLYASCSDDMRVIVSHGMVYDDWLKDPLIVPLKLLQGHLKFDDLYVLDVAWHPHEPYLFTAGADATIKLWH